MNPIILGSSPHWLLLVLLVWSFIWKGIALWHSARRDQYTWFIVLLVVNSAGILEIIYLFAVAKVKVKELFSRGGSRVVT